MNNINSEQKIEQLFKIYAFKANNFIDSLNKLSATKSSIKQFHNTIGMSYIHDFTILKEKIKLFYEIEKNDCLMCHIYISNINDYLFRLRRTLYHYFGTDPIVKEPDIVDDDIVEDDIVKNQIPESNVIDSNIVETQSVNSIDKKSDVVNSNNTDSDTTKGGKLKMNKLKKSKFNSNKMNSMKKRKSKINSNKMNLTKKTTKKRMYKK